MHRFNRILAAVDLSKGSKRALQLAVDLAYSRGTELHVLFVELLHGQSYDASVKREIEALVEGRMKAKGYVGLDVHQTSERAFDAAPAILEYAEAHDVDLIVMGTHGRRGLRALTLGSVAAEVVRVAPCTVLTVRDGKKPVPESIQRILVPYDFSDHSRDALAVALELAKSVQAHVDLIHIVEDRFHPAFYGPFLQSVYDMEPDIEKKAVRHLRTEIDQFGGVDLVRNLTAFGGYPARDISRYAERHEIDLIVMSTHGLTGLSHFVMGSVTEKTVSHAGCPVLIVKRRSPVTEPALAETAVTADI